MIKIICGPKGTGKTSKLIEQANADVKKAKGLSVFITDTDRYVYDVNRNVRFIDVTEYHVAGEDALCGFIKGVAAANHDTEYLYIDGISRIAGKPIAELAATFYMLEKVAEKNDLTITLTCSGAQEEMPAFVAKYL